MYIYKLFGNWKYTFDEVKPIKNYSLQLFEKGVSIYITRILNQDSNETKIITLGWSKGKDTFRSSRPEVFCEKGFLKYFAKFKGKHLCQSLFFNKIEKKRLWHRCFPVNFEKCWKIGILEN